MGMVSDVVGEPTRANPEDFIAIDPDGRLATVNSKASITSGACRITASGDLSPPQLNRRQREVGYSTKRAGLISPIDGDPFGLVVEVDLLHIRAQISTIGIDGMLTRANPPHPTTSPRPCSASTPRRYRHRESTTLPDLTFDALAQAVP